MGGGHGIPEGVMTREERFCARLDGYVEKIVRTTEKHYGLEPGSLGGSRLSGVLDAWLERVEDQLLDEYERDVAAAEAPLLEQRLRELLTDEPRPQAWFVAKAGSPEGAVAMRLQSLIDLGEAEWVAGTGYRRRQ